MRQYDKHGHLVNIAEVMESLGFQVGQSIIRKDKSQAVIESFHGEMVTMKTDHGQSKINYQTFLDGEWTKFNPKLPDEYLDDLYYYSPLQHRQSGLEYFKSCFLLEMRQQYHLHKAMEELVVIRLKPKGCMVRDKAVKKGKLILVPFTCSVMVKPVGQSPNSNLVLGEVIPGKEFSLAPVLFNDKADDPMACPFWYVQVVHDETEANMELTQVAQPKCHGEPLNTGKVKIPVLKNIVDLKPNDCLFVYKHKIAPKRTLDPLQPVRRVKGKTQA